MKIYKLQLCLLVTICFIFAGCSSKAAKSVKLDPEKNLVDIIAVLPVENMTKDDMAPELLRSKIIEDLYFKGYSKLSPEMIDRRLETLNINDKRGNIGIIAPQILKDLVGADAVLYATLTESNKPIGFFYAPVTISLHCELRKSDSGEVIWKGSYKSTCRNFAFTRKQLEMKSCKSYEEVIEEVVNKTMESIPYGPNLRG